jgi:hypothetical protein
MSNLFYLPRIHSEPLAKLYFYQTGTSTPQNTYTDIDLQVAHTNPVVADADGFFDPIYLDPSLPNYRVIHTDANDVPLEPTRDDVPAAGSSESTAYRLKSTAPGLIFEETDAGAGAKKWRIRVAGEVFSISTGDDAEAVWTDAISIDRDGNVTYLGSSGSFTGTQTGYASDLTPTIQWRRSGKRVTLSTEISSLGTSDQNGMTLAGIPAAIRPVQSLKYITRLTDNGVIVLGIAGVSTGGTITFGNGITDGTFTSSGQKGLPSGWQLTYEIG